MINDTRLLSADAKNRAIRTLYQNLGIDVLVAVVVLLLPVVTSAKSLNDIDWRVILFSVGKTILLTLFSYVMRRYMDRGKVPTPLPPEYPGQPNEDENVPYVPQHAMKDDGTPINGSETT